MQTLYRLFHPISTSKLRRAAKACPGPRSTHRIRLPERSQKAVGSQVDRMHHVVLCKAHGQAFAGITLAEPPTPTVCGPRPSCGLDTHKRLCGRHDGDSLILLTKLLKRKSVKAQPDGIAIAHHAYCLAGHPQLRLQHAASWHNRHDGLAGLHTLPWR